MTAKVDQFTPAVEFSQKFQRINALISFHRELGGTKAGKRNAELQILSESAIVLLYAAWDNYIEFECVFWAIHIVVHFKSPDDLPKSLKSFVAGKAAPAKGPLDNWIYAGENWKRETLVSVAREIFENHQASPRRVDDLIHKTLGYRDISKQWNWPAMSAARAQQKLLKYISMRGALAHTGSSGAPVTLDQCEEFANHLNLLVKQTSKLLVKFAQENLKIVSDEVSAATIDELVKAVYHDIENWQLSKNSDEISTPLRKKLLI